MGSRAGGGVCERMTDKPLQQPYEQALQRGLDVLCSRRPSPSSAFSMRFAAKEALSKALGVGIGSALSWHDMEIINDEQGKPCVIWHTDVAERFGVRKSHLSISHSHTIAMAYALLEQ